MCGSGHSEAQFSTGGYHDDGSQKLERFKSTGPMESRRNGDMRVVCKSKKGFRLIPHDF